VEGKTWMHVGDKWQCVSAGIPQGPLPKPEGPLPKVEYEVTVMRGQDLVIEGTPTRSYNSTSTQKFQGQSTTDKTRFYIGIQTGLPRRIVFEKDSGYMDLPGKQALTFWQASIMSTPLSLRRCEDACRDLRSRQGVTVP
jgi:hypothetical protein